MAYNRQQVLGEVNPLFKKFVHEGVTPSTYIPADKRREIYNYMGKTNYTKNMSKQALRYDLWLILLQNAVAKRSLILNFNLFRFDCVKYSLKIDYQRSLRCSNE